MILSYYVSDPIKHHVYFSGYFCFTIPLTMLFAAVLFFATGACGCGWTVSDRVVFMDVTFWQLSNNPPNSASWTMP